MGKNPMRVSMCYMLIGLFCGLINLCYWGFLRQKFSANSSDPATLSCNNSPLGCCPMYSHCGNTNESFQENIETRYIDLEAYHDHFNCPSLFQITREEARIEPGSTLYRDWSIYRDNRDSHHYCTIDTACDYYKRGEINDYESYKRNTLRGLYMFSTSLPKSDGCDNEWMIDTIITNFNRRVYFNSIVGYMYLSLCFLILFFLTLIYSRIDTSKIIGDIKACLRYEDTSYSGVSERSDSSNILP